MNESRRTGFLDGRLVRAMTFTIASVSIVVAVFACLAIWEFTGTDVLWRTVATCVVVAVGGRSHFPG